MSDPQIVKLEPPTRTYHFSHLGKGSTLSFDERRLYVRTERGVTKGTATYLLHHLSPRIEEECLNESGATTMVRVAWGLLLAAIVVYFSEVQEAMPLLAPALALLWIIMFAANCRQAWPYDWLTVGDEYGRTVATIRAVSAEQPAEKEKLERFVRNLTAAIEEARKNEYSLHR